MPHLAGVLDDRKDDSCIYIDETIGFYSSTPARSSMIMKYTLRDGFAVH